MIQSKNDATLVPEMRVLFQRRSKTSFGSTGRYVVYKVGAHVVSVAEILFRAFPQE